MIVRISAGEPLIGSKKRLNHEELFGVIYPDTGELQGKELPVMALTPAQCEFFKLFGYLYLPNLLAEEIE